MDKQNLEMELAHFTGSYSLHRFSRLFSQHVMTDGVKYLADNAGAYWLVEAIASHHHKCRGESFQVWELHKTKTGSAMLTCTGWGDVKIATQRIPFTDFPLDEIKLYCAQETHGCWVIMLPSEY